MGPQSEAGPARQKGYFEDVSRLAADPTATSFEQSAIGGDEGVSVTETVSSTSGRGKARLRCE